MKWQEIIHFDNEELQKLRVYTVGARNRLLKVIERTWEEDTEGLLYVAGCSTFQDDSLRLFTVGNRLNSTYLKQTSILANGTIVNILLDSWGLPLGIQPNTVSPISNKNVLFAYANGTDGKIDINNPIQKDTWAGIADEQGNLLYRVLLMKNDGFNEHNKINMFGINTAHQLVANTDTFIYVYYKKIGTRCNTIEWRLFDDKANLIGSKNLKMENGCVRSYNTKPTLDGGFLIAWSVYAVFLEPKSEKIKTSPFVIFSSTIAHEIKILACTGSVIGKGFNCFLQELLNKKKVQSYQINFLSSGMIHNVVPIESQIINKKSAFSDFLDIVGIPLQYGGFLLVSSSLRQNPFELLSPIHNNTRIHSILDLFQADGSLIKETFVEIIFTGGACLFRNNTVVLTGFSRNWWDPYKFQTLSIFTIDLPKFHDEDNGYQNLNIYSSYPALNEENIEITKETPQFRLSLTYRGIVEKSGQGSIHIFQADNDKYPRLTIPPNLINLVNENENFTKINVLLFSSTLNMPETKYYITVDDGMVETNELAEPLPGVKPAIWNFTTKKDFTIYSEKVNVLLRFNPDALPHFLKDFDETIKTIKHELSTFLPVNFDRLSASKWYFDNGNEHSYILLPIQISPGNPSSLRLVSDLNDLVTNSQYTNLKNGSMTKYLDSKYGAPIKENFFVQNMLLLILVGCFVIIVGILYIFANIRDGKARNIAVPQFALILSDFSLDLLFIVTHSKDIPFLFIPSLIFSIFPCTFNLFWSIYIVIIEAMHNEKFLLWFKLNNAIASTFTVLASTEVEVLSILNSRAGGFKVLQAPWSNWADRMIFMGITSSLVIFHAIVGKVYLGIVHWKHNHKPSIGPTEQHETTHDDDKFKVNIPLKGKNKSMRAQIVESDVKSISGEFGYI
ncbi:3207_t:CDS:2 [Rhizophagus irregularis]|nr:3207_t:CDS:2 [Rhizophagus irregularis]